VVGISHHEEDLEMSPHLSRAQRVGLALAALLSLVSIPSVLLPTPEDAEGPPMSVLVLSTLLGVIGLVAAVVALRSASRTAIRIVAGSLIISMLSGLPAFFVDVAAWMKLLSAITTLLTLTIVVLILRPVRRQERELQGTAA
jgi:hypothetical protein